MSTFTEQKLTPSISQEYNEHNNYHAKKQHENDKKYLNKRSSLGSRLRCLLKVGEVFTKPRIIFTRKITLATTANQWQSWTENHTFSNKNKLFSYHVNLLYKITIVQNRLHYKTKYISGIYNKLIPLWFLKQRSFMKTVVTNNQHYITIYTV